MGLSGAFYNLGAVQLHVHLVGERKTVQPVDLDQQPVDALSLLPQPPSLRSCTMRTWLTTTGPRVSSWAAVTPVAATVSTQAVFFSFWCCDREDTGGRQGHQGKE